ncbi:MAG: thermonuclease family protein [Notoacmeibacter sp.]
MSNRRYFYRRYRPVPLWRVFGEAALAAIILGLLSAAALTFSGSEVRSLPGQARAMDGDSLRLGDEEIRLWGIDAPELQQQCRNTQGSFACGREAQKQLKKLITNVNLVCKGLGRDRYDRLLGVCRIGTKDINAEMVRGGFAYAYGGYTVEESQARATKAGIWQAENERPKSYRDRTKADMDAAPGLLDAIYQWVNRLTIKGLSI